MPAADHRLGWGEIKRYLYESEPDILYVAVDIGCLECDNPSAVLGIFTDLKDARAVCDEAHRRAGPSLGHCYQVWPVEHLDEERYPDPNALTDGSLYHVGEGPYARR